MKVENKKINEMVFIRNHLPVRIRIVKLLSEEAAEELEIPNRAAGSELELAWWKVKILLDEGQAKLADTENIDEAYIQKKVWSEKSKTQLEELDKAFYLKVAYSLSKLKTENKINPSPILIQKIESIEVPLNDLLSSRIGKILKIAYRGAPPKILEGLTYEEKWLYEHVHQTIKIWLEKTLGD